MNDTPRTDAAEKHAYEFKDEYTPVCESKIVRQLERELNAAQDRIKRLEEESESRWMLAQSATGSCAEMSSRIKRLEDAGDALKAAGYFGGWADAVNKWIKAKEDKP